MRAGGGVLAAVLLVAGCRVPGQAEAGPSGEGVVDPLAYPASEPLPDRFGVGRPADADAIAALDVDVGPDGVGLPPGRGTAVEGARVYAAKCVACHGPEGYGTPLGEALVSEPDRRGFPDAETGARGGQGLGDYWPYATTVFDYVRRAMPYDRPGTLGDDEVYAVTAWLLYRHGIVAEDAVLDATTLPAVVMPARDRFVADDRLETNQVR